jgi:very-short-patch-repair endonuclease
LSHDHPQRASADSRKAHAVESAGLTLIRINVADMPNEAALRAQLPLRTAKAEARHSTGTSAGRR